MFVKIYQVRQNMCSVCQNKCQVCQNICQVCQNICHVCQNMCHHRSNLRLFQEVIQHPLLAAVPAVATYHQVYLRNKNQNLFRLLEF